MMNRTRLRRYLVRTFVVTAGLLVVVACTGGGGSTGGGGFTACTTDNDCPPEQGCNKDGDSYCSPLCDDDKTCPSKTACPSFTQSNGDCDEKGSHRNGRGVCEQFSSNRGPGTCANAPSTVVVPVPPPDASAPTNS